MSDAKRVHQVKSSEVVQCPVCDRLPEEARGMHDGEELVVQVNHMLGHGWKLLHVGQETSTGMDGDVWQQTTAVLGEPA